MKMLNLKPNQIITSSHEILHNIHILKIYFRIYQKKCGNILPPAPIIHKDLVIGYFNDKLRKIFEDFIKENPHAEYFLLDGSHKTTAANLTGNECNLMILESKADIEEAIQMERIGEVFQYNLDSNIKKIIEDLIKHLNSKKFFQTVEMKTKMLVHKKAIPDYMIQYYLKK